MRHLYSSFRRFYNQLFINATKSDKCALEIESINGQQRPSMKLSLGVCFSKTLEHILSPFLIYHLDSLMRGPIVLLKTH